MGCADFVRADGMLLVDGESTNYCCGETGVLILRARCGGAGSIEATVSAVTKGGDAVSEWAYTVNVHGSPDG